jgi:hypothetical protein
MDREPSMAVRVAQPSSRESAAGAGWLDCGGPGSWRSDVPTNVRRLSWLRPETLWVSRNDIFAKHLYDPVDRARVTWVRMARERARDAGHDEDFVVTRDAPGGTFSFLLIGDPGEGDSSQYAVVPALLSQSEGADFTIICSDLIYPSGEIADYRTKFFRPYRDLDTPIFAVPGNHDWYDGLHGFMSHICGIDAPQAPLEVGPGLRGALTRLLWRRSAGAGPDELAAMRQDRARPRQLLDPPQPAPYWAIDAGPVRLVGIDTGIVGAIDAEQGEWLRRVSFDSDLPKVLITGKPLIVNGKVKSCPIADSDQTVDEIVRDPEARYVAAIGGDTHNYQRYPVTFTDGRTIQYVVSGGGGAYMHATHQIPRVELDGVSEEDFRCYPLRGDSLAVFSRRYDERFAGGSGKLELSPEEASTYMGRLLGMTPTRGETTKLSSRAETAAKFIQPAPATRGFHRFASEAFDWDDPPFFKHFLRIDVEPGALRLRCFGVSGCAKAATQPPVEDDLTVAL